MSERGHRGAEAQREPFSEDSHRGTEAQREPFCEDGHRDTEAQRKPSFEDGHRDTEARRNPSERGHGDAETQRQNQITQKIIGCAIEVHRHLGATLMEAGYQRALSIELAEVGLRYEQQTLVAATYKGHPIGEYRIDFIVEDAVVVEIKSVDRIDPVFEAQILTYLKVTGKRIGLLVNFNSRFLRDGIRRFVL